MHCIVCHGWRGVLLRRLTTGWIAVACKHNRSTTVAERLLSCQNDGNDPEISLSDCVEVKGQESWKSSPMGGYVMQGNCCERRVLGNTVYISLLPNVDPTTTTRGCDNDDEDGSDVKPDSVLQYELQLKKFRAHSASYYPSLSDAIKILYEDDHIVVVNKPSGLQSVPGVDPTTSSLLSVLFDDTAQSILSSSGRGGNITHPNQRIIHRLDMDTSGVVVFGNRRMESIRYLHEQFRTREVEKSYEALLCGHVDAELVQIDLPLQRDHAHPPFMRVATLASEHALASAIRDLHKWGYSHLIHKRPRASRTICRVVRHEWYRTGDRESRRLPVTRVRLAPITGRTHQLRAHCAAIGHPIVGDVVYGNASSMYGDMAMAGPNAGFDKDEMDAVAPDRASLQLKLDIQEAHDIRLNRVMCLHAQSLRLRHPGTREWTTFETPVMF